MAESDVDGEYMEADDGTLSDEDSVYDSCSDGNGNDDDEQEEEEESEDDDDDDDDDDHHEEPEDNDLDISLNDDDDNANSSQCPVCLMSLTGQQLGTPNNCEHVFCFLCISEWSKNSNTCPVDRTKFDEILVHTTKKGPVIKRVKVEDKKVLTDQDWEQAPTYCEICEQSNREAMMLLCDGCDRGYHMFCLTPRLYEVPAGDWYCDTCFVIRNETSLDEGIPVADLMPSTSGISEAAPVTSNRERSSSTRGRGRSRRGTGSRKSTTRRSRSSSTRGRKKSKRGRGRKRGSSRSTTSSTRKRKGKTKKGTNRKTSKSSSKKSPKKKRKLGESDIFQPPLIPGLERLGGRSSNDRTRPVGTSTALSIFGNEFALHDFEAEVEETPEERPATPSRLTNNSTDVLTSIMDGLEVLHDEDARVSRDGSVLPSQDQKSPPKSSSNSPEKMKTADDSPRHEETHQSPVKKISPLKRPSSTSPVDNADRSKVKKVSFNGVADGTPEEKPSDTRDIADRSRDHTRGHSPDVSQELKDSSVDRSSEYSQETYSLDNVAERSRDLSRDDLRRHLSELSRHHAHNPRDYSRDRLQHSRYSRDFPREYKHDTSMKDFPRGNSQHSHDSIDFERNYNCDNSRRSRDLKDFPRDRSRDSAREHWSGQSSRISPSLRESPSFTTSKQQQSNTLSNSLSNKHFFQSIATTAGQAANGDDVRQSRDGDSHFNNPHMPSSSRSLNTNKEVEVRKSLLSRLGNSCSPSSLTTKTTTSQSSSSRYDHSSVSPSESMMTSRSDVMKPQTLSSRFSNPSPRVPMVTRSSSDAVTARQTLSSRFSSSSVSPVVSTATLTSSKPHLTELKTKSKDLTASVAPDRQKLPNLPSLSTNSTHPALPRLKSFKASDSHVSSRPKLKGLSTSNDKKSEQGYRGYPKPDSSYRQNLAIIDMLRAKKSTLKAEIKKDDVTAVNQSNQPITEGYSKLPSSFNQSEHNQTQSDANFHRPKLSSLMSRNSSLPVAIVRPRTANCESEVSVKSEVKRESSLGASTVSSGGAARISSDDDERLHNRRKGIARLQRLTSIKDTVRLVLQPFYDHREISRTEFKDIFIRAVQKVNESSQDVNYLRIAYLVKKYVKKYKGLRLQSGQMQAS